MVQATSVYRSACFRPSRLLRVAETVSLGAGARCGSYIT